MSAAGKYYRERSKHCMDLAEIDPIQKLPQLAAASVCLNLAIKFDREDQTERHQLPSSSQLDAGVVAAGTPAEQNTMRLAERRRANSVAMRSPGSVFLGISVIVLLALASVFYDHPSMRAPQMLTSLHRYVIATF